jgi:hypothetical protein
MAGLLTGTGLEESGLEESGLNEERKGGTVE